eukprot:COSAG02_NODE_1253_length_13598_cov_3.599526_5_plen_123_part_00
MPTGCASARVHAAWSGALRTCCRVAGSSNLDSEECRAGAAAAARQNVFRGARDEHHASPSVVSNPELTDLLAGAGVLASCSTEALACWVARGASGDEETGVNEVISRLLVGSAHVDGEGYNA